MSGYADIDTLVKKIGPLYPESNKQQHCAHAALSRVRELAEAAEQMRYAPGGDVLVAREDWDRFRAALRAVREGTGDGG